MLSHCSVVRGGIDTLRDALQSDQWHPSPLRRVYIPKSSGRGRRPIDIPTVEDRVVETALYMAMEPLWDHLMHWHSTGFRIGRSLQQGLAMAIGYAVHRDRWTMTALDLRKAFSRVPQKGLIDVVNKFTPNPEMTTTISKIIRRQLPAGEGIRRGLGLAQGSPLSPLLLNLYLTVHLDERWAAEHPDTPIIRYADDLLLLTQTPGQAEAAIEQLRQRLEPHGMVLRKNPAPQTADLRTGEHVDIWGYRLSRPQEAVRIQVPDDYFSIGDISDRDRRKLDAETITAYVRGKLEHAGPTYPGRDAEHYAEREDVLSNLVCSLSEAGIDCPLPTDEMHRIWRSAYDRWTHICEATSEQWTAMNAVSPLPAATPPGSLTQGWARTARQVIAARAGTP